MDNEERPAEEPAQDVGPALTVVPPQPPKKSAAKWVILILAVLAVAATVVIVLATRGGTDSDDVLANGAGGDYPLEEAAELCGATPEAIQTADEGRTLILDTEGEEAGSGELTFFDVICVTGFLGMPDAVYEHVQATRALDGMQTDSWDQFEARWTYHPDSGLDITITDSED